MWPIVVATVTSAPTTTNPDDRDADFEPQVVEV
jgi:hypothetical protein